MTVRADYSEVDLLHHDIPTPAQNYPTFALDPDLGLTPDRSPVHQQRRCVRFISPAKSKARRKLENKENYIDLASVQLPCDVVVSKASKKEKHEPQKGKNANTIVPRVEKALPCSSNSLGKESHLDKPEFNTTLHLGSDILKLKAADIDIVEAVKHRLAVSEVDRKTVKEKVYSKLNGASKDGVLFDGTVPVNVPDSLLIEQVEKQLNKKVKPFKANPKPENQKPTLMTHFRPELAFHRSLSLDQHGYQPSCLKVAVPQLDQRVFEQHTRIILWSQSNS